MSLPGEEDKDARIPPYGVGPLESPARARISDPGGSKLRPDTSYRECQKNHAASDGGNVTDGCGEFMPGGEDGTLEALKCAACGCHRNFHRKEHHGVPAVVHHHHHHHPHLHLPPGHHHRAAAWGSVVQPLKVAYGTAGAGTDSSSEELNFNPYRSSGVAPPPPQFGGRKRFRTKFTAEQKERMLEFAERLGWRIPREDDSEVQRFCAEVGVKRQVFKVWMHNNKTLSSSRKNSQPINI